MNATVITAFRDMGRQDRAKVLREQLMKPIHEILVNYGDLPREGIQYFLESIYNISIADDSARRALQMLTGTTGFQAPVGMMVEEYWHADSGKNLYSTGLRNKKGEPVRKIKLAVPENYSDAYYQLLIRYNAIRKNPDLAAMSEEYIDNLYTPVHSAGEQQ